MQQVKCWGLNNYGQLGGHSDTQNNVGDSAGEMGDYLPYGMGRQPGRSRAADTTHVPCLGTGLESAGATMCLDSWAWGAHSLP
jgi:hypothetical protein